MLCIICHTLHTTKSLSSFAWAFQNWSPSESWSPVARALKQPPCAVDRQSRCIVHCTLHYVLCTMWFRGLGGRHFSGPRACRRLSLAGAGQATSASMTSRCSLGRVWPTCRMFDEQKTRKVSWNGNLETSTKRQDAEMPGVMEPSKTSEGCLFLKKTPLTLKTQNGCIDWGLTNK